MSQERFNNDAYGAFEIKRVYPKNYLIGVSAAVLLHLLVMIVFLVFYPNGDEEKSRSVIIKLIPYSQLGPPPSIIQNETAIEKVKPEKPTFGNPVAAKKGEQTSEFKTPTGSSDSAGDVKVEPPKVEEKKEEKVEAPYLVSVDMMPEPIGGMKGIQSQIIYPPAARNAKIEGRVLVKAFVNDQGSVTRAEIIKGIGYGCDEEALRIIRNTAFKPGKLNGMYVNVQITIPIIFSLGNSGN